MTEWRINEDAVRAALEDQRDMSPPVSAEQLRAFGYLLPGGDAADARTQADARDARLLRAVPDVA